jgi:hypothetical protein
MTFDGPVIVALAALAGSLVGAFSSVAATFMGQRLQGRWTQVRAELEEREKLYGLFVEEAVHLFVDSIQRSKIDPAKIMRLYSKVARIRLTSTDQVLQAAEKSAGGWLKLMNGHRTIPLRFSRDMPTAKTILIPCENLPRLAGSSGRKPFNRSEDAFRHPRPPVVTIHDPAADGKLTTSGSC